MSTWVLAFFGGIFGFNQLSELPSLFLFFLLLAATIFLFSLNLFLKARWIWIIHACLLGFIYCWCWAVWQMQYQLPNGYEGKDLLCKGVIISIPEQETNLTRFRLKIISIDNKINLSGLAVILSWYKPQQSLKIGQTWQLHLRLKRPHGLMNPGGFSYEAWLWQEHIQATGYVLNKQNNQLLVEEKWDGSNLILHRFLPLAGGGVKVLIYHIRQVLNDGLTQALQGLPYQGFIKALTIGVRDNISQEAWQILRATGTNHLMAISGLHIGFLAGFGYQLGKWVAYFLPKFLLRLPSTHFSAIGALIFATSYSALAGFSLPTQRAVIMISVFMFAQLLRRNLSIGNGLAVALLLVLLLNPFSPLSSSFWLSFAAVAFIVFGMAGQKPRQFWWQWGRIQIILTLGLLPFTFLFFQEAPFSAIFANALAIPWVGFAVMPCALLACVIYFINPAAGMGLMILAEKLLAWFWPYLQWLASLSQLQWQYSLPNMWVFVTLVIGLILLLSPRGLPGRWLAAIFLLPLFFYPTPKPLAGQLWFSLLDVGQGLSVVVQTAQHTLVYDTGPKFSDQFDMGASVITPFLQSQNIHVIDKLIISHGDNDHSGGAASLLQSFTVKSIETSVPERFSTAIPCLAGSHWQWDGVDFNVLYPFASQNFEGNNNSCVLQIRVGTQRILLVGDIEKIAEEKLVQYYGKDLQADIVVAPHHGSRTSSSAEFVAAVKPRYVLFPVGYHNRYHFPSALVVQRYKEQKATLMDTVTGGALQFFLEGSSVVHSEQYRITHRWYYLNG